MKRRPDVYQGGRVGGSGGVRVDPRRSARRWREWTLLACSVSLTIALGEAVARRLLPAPLPWLYPQLRYRPDPGLVFALAADQAAFAADKAVHINSRGLRDAEVPYARIPDRLRLLWLGDSIVFGFGVPAAQVVARRVDDRLDHDGLPAESINAAVPAYNTEQEVDFMAREGVRYHADWVVLGFCWNDINDQEGARVCPNGWLVSKRAGGKACEPTFTESPRGYAIRNFLKRSRLAYSVMEGLRAFEGDLSPDDHAPFRREVLEGGTTRRVREGWERVDWAVHRLAGLGEKTGFRTLVVAFPIPLALETSYPMSDYPAHLERIARQDGLPFLDLEPSFRAAYRGHESLFLPYDADHPNAAGHDLAARDIAALLLARARPPGGTLRDETRKRE